jgi:hypothetical protein
MATESELLQSDPSQEDESDLGPTKGGASLSASDWTAETIVSQMKRGNILLNPRFQRREAWTDERKSRFIESLILGLPIPQLVLAEARGGRGTYIVIDGKQRLLTLRRFAASTDKDDSEYQALRLTGLTLRPELNGKTFEALLSQPSFAQDVAAFENQTIRTVVLRQWPDESYLYMVFHRLNTGSVPLSPQELRQALHPGPFLDFVDTFSAESEAIHAALHIDRADFRMRDAEVLVRFFAFSEFLNRYNGNLKAFLDSTSSQLNDEWESRAPELESLALACEEAIEVTRKIFHEDAAFTFWNGERYEGRFNRAVFDIMTYYFKRPGVARAALRRAARIRKQFERLCETDSEFRDSLQTTTKSVGATYTRLKKWGDAVARVTETRFPRPKLVDRRIRV